MARLKTIISRQELVDLYVDRRMSMAKIASVFKVNVVTILKRLREYGIASRSRSEALNGRIPWNKGKKWLSGEAKKSISEQFRVLWQNEEFKRKMKVRNTVSSERMKGDGNPMKNKIVSEKVRRKLIGKWMGATNPMKKAEVREKVRKFLLGHDISLETKEKISKSLMGRFGGDKNPFFGKQHTPEVREKSRVRAINQLVSGVFRGKPTSIELKIEEELLKRNIEHKKQFPLIGITVVDFYLSEHKIVIYADGEFWHKSKWAEKHGTIEKDKKQNRVLLENGYQVFRFSELEINRSVVECVTKVVDYINNKAN